MRNRSRSHDNGVALVAVLWTMVLLGMLGAALVAISRADTRTLDIERQRFQAEEYARAAINLAIVAISGTDKRWPVDGTPQTIEVGGVSALVGVSAEGGKVDLNTASPDLLKGLLTVEGQGAGSADALTEAIVARRQSSPFTNLAELLQMPDVTFDFYAQLTPNLTLYSGSNSVNTETAPMDVLMAIPGNTRADAEAEMARRAEAARNESGDGNNSIPGQAYTVSAQLTAGPSHVLRTHIVRLTGDRERPVFVLEAH